MTERRAWFELWSDLKCASGATKLRNLPPAIAGSRPTFAVDHAREMWRGAFPLTAGWRQDLALGTVLRYGDPLGNVSEWRLSSFTEKRGRADAFVEVECDPPIFDLANIDVLVSVGGVPKGNLGIWEGDIVEAYDTFIDSLLPTHVDRGNIGTSDRFSLPFDHYSALELLIEIAKEGRVELDYRRDGDSGYLVDLVAEIGASATKIYASIERGNAIEVERFANLDDFCTTVKVLGATVSGSTEQATMAEAAYEILAVDEDTPSSGKDRIQIGPVAGGGNGIGFDGQVDGQYVQFEDGQVELILSDPTSVAEDGYFWVADRGTAEAGDIISFRADSSGGHIIEVSNPAALAATGGRIYRRTIRLPEMRPERNYQPNPVMNEWQAATKVPENWEGTTTIATDESGRYDRSQTEGGTFDLEYNGTHTSTNTINVKGLTPGDVINAGWFCGTNGSTENATIQDYVVADGSGLATFDIGFNVTKSDGDPIRIYRAAGLFGGVLKGDNAWAVLSANETAADPATEPNPRAASKAAGLVYWSGMPTVHFAMGLTYESRRTTDVTLTQDSDPRPAYVWLLDESDNSVLASAQGETRTLANQVPQHEVIKGSYTLTEDKTVRVVLKRPSGGATLANGLIVTYIRWAAIWISTDPETPPIIGGYATRGRDVANAELAKFSQPFGYEAEIRPFAQLAGYNPAFETPTVGGQVAITAFDTTADLRILEYSPDAHDLSKGRVLLNRTPTRVYDHLRRIRYPQPVSRPVIDLTGAYRAVAPVNAEIRSDPSSTSAGAGALTVAPYDPSDFEES